MGKHSWTRSVGVSILVAAAVAVGPANTQVRPAERAQAAREHPALLAQFGGPFKGPQEQYVQEVGARMASAAGLRDQCTFSVVNTDVVNAFAVPGCYVYVTRGLLALVNSEDELAFVLGHEIGHITGKHAQKRQQSSVLTGLGAAILSQVAKNSDLGQIFGQGAQLYTLKYSRDQEYQADDLGGDYLARAGYSQSAAADMLNNMQRYDALQARIQQTDADAIPQWASSHPASAERTRRAGNRVRTPAGYNTGTGRRETDRYLTAVDGLVFGDDAEQGFVRGASFVHPGLRIGFEAPYGFGLTNGTDAVLVVGRNGAKAQFTGGRMAGPTLEDHAQAALRSVIGAAQAQYASPQRTTINGLEAVIQQARVRTSSGGVADVSVAAYRIDRDTAYQFVTIAPSGQGQQFDPLIRSFHRLSDREAANLQPRRIQVVSARGGETVRTMAAQMAVDSAPAEWFAVLNNLPADATLRPGQRVKIVVEDRGRGRRSDSAPYGDERGDRGRR